MEIVERKIKRSQKRRKRMRKGERRSKDVDGR